MATPHVLILRAPGTNCDHETDFAFAQAGGHSDRIHVNRLLQRPAIATEYQILCIPGGFSYGDDIAAGRILGNQIRHHLADALREFRDQGKLILGVCNGFQVLMKSGILPHDESDDERAAATLTWNDSGKFEDRWVELESGGSACVFLRDIDRMYLPVAHAEGKFVPRDEAAFSRLEDGGHFALRYRAAQNENGRVVPYPDNPNGSAGNVAGVCDSTGRVLGLMPHPERYIDPTHHPRWTRGELPEEGDGLKMFRNAVEYFS